VLIGPDVLLFGPNFVVLSTIITTATTTATTSSSRRRRITAPSGRAEGEYIGIDALFPYSVPEFIDLTHPPPPEKGLPWDWGHDLALYKLGGELTKFSGGHPLIAVVLGGAK
jgi:hypothetical protein